MQIDAIKSAAASFKSAVLADDRRGLISAARQLVKLEAPLGNQWIAASQAIFRWGELELALAAIETWRRQGAPTAAANYEKATLLSRAGQTERAQRVVSTLPLGFPTPVANAYLRGALAINLGNKVEAEKQFRKALDVAPNSGRSWQGIAQFGELQDSDVEAMRKLADAAVFEEEEDHAAIENALGIAEHTRGNRSAAFAHFEKSTNIIRRGRPHDRRDNERSAAISALWSASTIGELSAQTEPARRKPIFVSGLPRSGTTLVQQILASHSAVDGGGELGLAMQLEAMTGGFAPDDVRHYLAEGNSLDELRQLYMRLAAERIPGEGFFVDKSLNQSRSLGPFSVLFPDAPIIWLRRDPLDNAWSIYRTWMARSAVGGWSLEDIAHHMRLEDELYRHWRNELGDRVLEVPYEELVTSLPSWIERIDEHCGLAVEEAQLEFHTAAGGVTTASSMQVREPVTRRAIGAAEPYREFLRPFIDGYPAAADKVPAEKTPAPSGTTLRDFVAALKQHDRSRVRLLAARMLEDRAPIGVQWKSVATVMLHDKEYELARRATDAFLSEVEGAQAAFDAASLKARLGDQEAALELLNTVVPDNFPGPAEVAYFRGTLETDRGNLVEAREHLRKAVEHAPLSGEAWLALTMAGGVGETEGARLVSLEPEYEKMADLQSAQYFKALGRWYERKGEASSAFEAFRRSGNLLSGIRAYNAQEDLRDCNQVLDDWTADRLARYEPHNSAHSPIFVTGLPRSGTTLVEQILVSHSSVTGGAEIELLHQCARTIGGKRPENIEAYLSKAGSLDTVRELYMRLGAERFGPGRFIDKSLSTSRLAGLAASLFPEAPFVWLRRDRPDNAWSIFRTYFQDSLPWGNSLEDIGFHMALEERLFEFWRGLLGDRLLAVNYSELVERPDTTIRQIANHCGLEFEEAMLEPHLLRRSVGTNSVAQVRSPINREGLEIAKPYEKYLEPFKAAYAAQLGNA